MMKIATLWKPKNADSKVLASGSLDIGYGRIMIFAPKKGDPGDFVACLDLEPEEAYKARQAKKDNKQNGGHRLGD